MKIGSWECLQCSKPIVGIQRLFTRTNCKFSVRLFVRLQQRSEKGLSGRRLDNPQLICQNNPEWKFRKRYFSSSQTLSFECIEGRLSLMVIGLVCLSVGHLGGFRVWVLVVRLLTSQLRALSQPPTPALTGGLQQPRTSLATLTNWHLEDGALDKQTAATMTRWQTSKTEPCSEYLDENYLALLLRATPCYAVLCEKQ